MSVFPPAFLPLLVPLSPAPLPFGLLARTHARRTLDPWWVCRVVHGCSLPVRAAEWCALHFWQLRLCGVPWTLGKAHAYLMPAQMSEHIITYIRKVSENHRTNVRTHIRTEVGPYNTYQISCESICQKYVPEDMSEHMSGLNTCQKGCQKAR